MIRSTAALALAAVLLLPTSVLARDSAQNRDTGAAQPRAEQGADAGLLQRLLALLPLRAAPSAESDTASGQRTATRRPCIGDDQDIGCRR